MVAGIVPNGAEPSTELSTTETCTDDHLADLVGALTPTIRRVLQHNAVRVTESEAVQISNSTTLSTARRLFTPLPGSAHKYGRASYLTVLLHSKPCSAVFDTGAGPSVITADYLHARDPNFESRLTNLKGLEARGFGGSCKVLGTYACTLVLPHVIGSLAIEVEFLVISSSSVPYQMVIGRDTHYIYAMNLVTPSGPSKNSYIQIGKHPQRYAVLDSTIATPSACRDIANASMAATNGSAPVASVSVPPLVSVRNDVRYTDFLEVLKALEREHSVDFSRTIS